MTRQSITRSPDAFRRSASWRASVWLLIGLIALQVIGLGVLAVIGPAHTHRAGAEPSRLVLEDFRRGPMKTFGSPAHVATVFGHVHRFDAAMRHHHPRIDSTVVLDDRDALQQAAEPGTSPTLMAVVGLPPEADRCAMPVAGHALPHRPTWSWLTHDPESEERPPRSA